MVPENILVLMLTISKLPRTPHTCTVLFILLITRELCEKAEHAWKLCENSDDFI